MLHMQEIIDAAIATFGSIPMKTIPEPGTFHTQSRHTTTQLLRSLVHILIIHLYLYKTACNAVLNKRLVSAALDHYIFSCY